MGCVDGERGDERTALEVADGVSCIYVERAAARAEWLDVLILDWKRATQGETCISCCIPAPI